MFINFMRLIKIKSVYKNIKSVYNIFNLIEINIKELTKYEVMGKN